MIDEIYEMKRLQVNGEIKSLKNQLSHDMYIKQKKKLIRKEIRYYKKLLVETKNEKCIIKNVVDDNIIVKFD